MAETKKLQLIMTVNGVDIYEGDITLGSPVKSDGKMIRDKRPIGWDEEEQRFGIDISFSKDGSLFDALSDYTHNPDFEIIGNRHKNPELMNVLFIEIA